MKIKIEYKKQVDKFLDKNHILTKDDVRELIILALKKIFKQEDINIDLVELKGYKKGFFRIRKGKS